MRSKRTKQANGNGDFARNRVFEIAAEVFHRKGYDNTSMSEIANAAGLTKAGLYHHIDSKESLLCTVLDYGLDLTEFHVVKPLQEIADPLERLSQFGILLTFRLEVDEADIRRAAAGDEVQRAEIPDRHDRVRPPDGWQDARPLD